MDPSPRPTRIRYLVVAVTAAAAVLLYLDRVCISFAGTYLREELGLSAQQMSWIFGAFFLTYALGQVPAGWLSDRFGARRMMVAYILAWSLFTAGTALTFTFGAVLAARLAFGFAQSGAYPTAVSLLGRWIPASERGRANSFVALGGRVGGATAPLLTALLIVALVPVGISSLATSADLLDPAVLAQPSKPFPTLGPFPSLDELNRAIADPSLTDGLDLTRPELSSEAKRLAVLPTDRRSPDQTRRLNRLVLETAYPGAIRQIYGAGWRPALLLYGALGLAVALAYWFIVRDQPDRHPWCNTAEAKLAGPTTTVRVGAIPWKTLATNANMCRGAATQFCVNVGWVFLITLLPEYLSNAHSAPIEDRGMMASVPLLAGVLGMLAGGVTTDALTRRFGKRWGRVLPYSGAQLICALACVACLGANSAWAAVAFLAVVALATDLASPALWSFTQDVGGAHTGAAMGWVNMWGNLGAALSPVLLTAVRDRWDWNGVFLACAVSFLIASVAASGIDATRPLAGSKGDPIDHD